MDCLEGDRRARWTDYRQKERLVEVIIVEQRGKWTGSSWKKEVNWALVILAI